MGAKNLILKYLTKRGCMLCERGYYILDRIESRYPSLEVKIVDITKEVNYLRYKNEIPVVLINEEVAGKERLSERKIKEFIEKKIMEIKKNQ